ncbi:MAG TPA: glycosyltransferase family 4 protein [Dehalococcoidia bacterium]
MRVGFFFPNYFPYVRRGAERVMVEYGRYLTGQGHDVDIVTTKPGKRRVVKNGKLNVYYESQLNHPVLAQYKPLFRFYSFSLMAMKHLLTRDYDVLHMWLYMYGLPMRLTRRLKGTPYLYHQMMETTVVPEPFDEWLFRNVVIPADRVATLTNGFAAKLEKQIGVPVDILPPCVDMDTFVPTGERDVSEPRILFASDVHDYHKGGHVILKAWDEIHRRCPEAILSFGGPGGQTGIPTFQTFNLLDEYVKTPEARKRIEFLGVGSEGDVPRRYARSSVTILPSVWEGFGLVLLESLACGTPVVGNGCGGPGEIITDERIGATISVPDFPTLADPKLPGELAERVLHAIDLARRPETNDICREHARQWSREAVGEKLEEIYGEMVNNPVKRPVEVAA